jgi:Protein of unknown function (DUF2905)
MPEIGKLLVIIGGLFVVIGLFLWSELGGNWFGRLPGDIRIEKGNFGFYFPIVTCIILSLGLTFLISLFHR